jgi:hypothetical protein
LILSITTIPNVPLELSLSRELPQPLIINDPEKRKTILYNINRLSFTTSIQEESGRAVVEKFAYRFDGHSCRIGSGKWN